MNFTVTQLNEHIKELFSLDRNIKNITLVGEVSNFTDHKKTGHFYFTIKDEQSSMQAVMFKFNAMRVKFNIENGMKIIVTGSVDVFVRNGAYQFYCDTLEPVGIGGLHLAFEQLKEKLDTSGYFDPQHKLPIPSLPKKIAVITAKTGAAFQDILNIISRRYPIAKIVLIPALVQGQNASASLVNAVKIASSQSDIDLIIIGRGGGSIEDLWCFNDEKLAIELFNCKIPTISAVGHEIDFTICDFVADLRAPTPSAAAELCCPDINDIRAYITSSKSNMANLVLNNLKLKQTRLQNSVKQLHSSSPKARLKNYIERFELLQKQLHSQYNVQIQNKSQLLSSKIETLEALSPLKVLARGYSITYKDGLPVTNVADLSSGDRITSQINGDSVTSIVE